MPMLLAGIIDATYTPVTNYGGRGEPTTFRKELIRVFSEQMQYKSTNSRYDKNSFTTAVDTMVEEECKKFKLDYNTKVDATFTAAALKYASDALRKKLGIEP